MRKISIITATFNSAKTLRATLDSVLKQDYANIEHIIIDGKSSDDTLAIAQSYEKLYANKGFEFKIFSERDNGIYDAMNKGLARATGEIIGFLNSDDFFASKYIASLIAWGFAKPTNDIEIIYANIDYVNNSLQTRRILRGKPLSPLSFKLGFHPPHPSFYAKKELFVRYGGFKLQYKIASDYELMLRFLQKYHAKSLYIDECFVKMRLGGASNASMASILRANIECFKSWQENGLSKFPLFVVLKPLHKCLDKLKNLIIPKEGGGQYEVILWIISPFRLSQKLWLFQIFLFPINHKTNFLNYAYPQTQEVRCA